MILILDGNNIAMRSFFTPQGALATKAGEPTGVMLGFLNSVKGYLERFPEVTQVVATWDGGRAKWRKEIYPEYKGNRDYGKEDPEKKAKFDGLFAQMEMLHQFVHNMGMNSLKFKGWEADDLIAAVCKERPGHKMIVTSDKDMFQLVSEDVSIFNLYKEVVISPYNFEEQTGIPLDAYMGYRALLGDKSDNIPGIEGIGEVTAKNIIKKYGHIDNILNATGDDKKALLKSARTKRIFEPENLKILGRNHRIMNFKYIDYSEIHQELSMELVRPVKVNGPEVKEFLKRWQFVSVLTNYMAWISPFYGLGED